MNYKNLIRKVRETQTKKSTSQTSLILLLQFHLIKILPALHQPVPDHRRQDNP